MTVKELEKQRIDKIRNLNLEETKKYIKSLNKKRIELFKGSSEDLIDFYDDKLKEVFDLTSEKFPYLDYFSLHNRLDLTNVMLLETTLRKHIINVSYTALLLNNGYFTLTKELNSLKLLAEKSDDRLIKLAIDDILSSVQFTIQSLEVHEKEFNEDRIISQINQIDYERQYVLEKSKYGSETIELLEDSEYLNLLETYRESFVSLFDILRDYSAIKSEVLEFLKDFETN